ARRGRGAREAVGNRDRRCDGARLARRRALRVGRVARRAPLGKRAAAAVLRAAARPATGAAARAGPGAGVPRGARRGADVDRLGGAARAAARRVAGAGVRRRSGGHGGGSRRGRRGHRPVGGGRAARRAGTRARARARTRTGAGGGHVRRPAARAAAPRGRAARAAQPRPPRRPAAAPPLPPRRRGDAGRRGAGTACRRARPPGRGTGGGGVRPRLAAAEVALAGIALLVVARTRDGHAAGPEREGSFTALAGSSGPAAFGRRTACGGTLTADTEGVAHPTLPCGARIFITYGGQTVLTQVVDRGPYEPARQFDLTDALARRLGLRGVQQIHWSYARGG